MKKLFILFAAVLVSSIPAFSQTENDEHQKKEVSDDNFKKETEGIFYVLIPIDEFLAKQGLAVIKSLNEEKEFSKLVVRHLWLEDLTVESGLAHFIIVRRFKEDIAANEYLIIIDKKFSLSKGNSVIIAQSNFRLLLEKKKSFEEYLEFLKNE